MFYIYRLTNTQTGKVYIGQTSKTVEKRWRAHCNIYRHPSVLRLYLYNSMRKYGPAAFHVEQIDCATSQEEANELEKLYIGIFNSWRPQYGYNLTRGGQTGPIEGLRKAWATLRGKPRDPESVKRSADGQRGPKSYNYHHDAPSEEMKALYDSGLSTAEIGKRFGMSGGGVGKRLRILGTKMRTAWGAYTHPDVSDEELKTLYESGLSCKKIGLRFDLSDSWANKRLHKLGVVLRDGREAQMVSA